MIHLSKNNTIEFQIHYDILKNEKINKEICLRFKILSSVYINESSKLISK